MSPTADRLARILAATPPRFADISDAEASLPAAPGRWSRKQILGHLIDSAANNHQRFVRAQLEPSYQGPTYSQNQWVDVQGYAEESWPDLVNLWLLYNRHLLHLIRRTPEAALSSACLIEGEPPMPLARVMSGYLDHLEHHLGQIFS